MRSRTSPAQYPCGHARAEENSYHGPDGRTRCRACMLKVSNRQYEKRTLFGCGHPITDANTGWSPSGTHRHCLQCKANPVKPKFVADSACELAKVW